MMSDTELRDTVTDLAKQVVALDKVVTKLVSSMDSHVHEERAMEQTLRNIDDSLNALSLKYAAGPMERHREVELLIKPLYDKNRELESKIIEINAATEKRMKANAISHLAIAIALMGIIATVAGYAYFSDKDNLVNKIDVAKELLIKDIKENAKDIKENIKHIDDHHKRHQ